MKGRPELMAHILSVSYDASLLATREMILKLSGYEVTSAEGFTEAMERCRAGKFDMLIIGHSIPHKDKQAIISEVRKVHPVPVLALLRPNEHKIKDATQSFEAALGPEALLKAVRSVLEEHK